jgi:hypothetical protein
MAATDKPQATSPDFLFDIVSGTERTGFAEDPARRQAEAAAYDLFLDLGDPAEALQRKSDEPVMGPHPARAQHCRRNPLSGVKSIGPARAP